MYAYESGCWKIGILPHILKTFYTKEKYSELSRRMCKCITFRPITASGIVGCHEMSWCISVVNKRILPCANWWFNTTFWLAYKSLKQQIILWALIQASTKRILFSIEMFKSRYRPTCIPPKPDMVSHQDGCTAQTAGGQYASGKQAAGVTAVCPQ